MRSWADLPLDRPIRIEGATAEVLALSIEPLPRDAPAIIIYQAQSGVRTAPIVATLLTRLDRIARELFPAWLPEARHIDSPTGAGAVAVRSIAMRAAQHSAQHGAFLADLAERALCRQERSAGGFSPEVRAAGLAKVVAASFGRARAAILIRVPDGLAAEDQQALAAAGQWLADNADFGVWFAGAALSAVDAVPAVAFNPPAQGMLVPGEPGSAAGQEAAGAQGGVGGQGSVRYPPLAGQPHPASRAERFLEAALKSAEWATGREWNQPFQPHSLTNPVRPDLLWRAERCVVEIDGAEHCEPTRFAADRQRDVLLQLAGYGVLRFTNHQVLQHRDLVLVQIRQFVTGRRAGHHKGAIHVRAEAFIAAADASSHPDGGGR